MNDQLQAFLINKDEYRGVLVRLDASYQDILACHTYPPGLRKLLGEAVVAVTLLGNNLKQPGRLALQIETDDVIKLLVTEINDRHGVRGLIQWRNEVPLTEPLIKGGKFVITMMPDQGERYQGVVPIVWQSFAKSLESYFHQSEQIFTRILLVTDGDKAAGLLLQKLPSEYKPMLDDETLNLMLGSFTPEDLFAEDSKKMLARLFPKQAIELFEPEPVAFECTCSHEKMVNAVRMLGKADALELLSTYKNIEVNCEFCNHNYNFNRQEIEQIFLQDEH